MEMRFKWDRTSVPRAFVLAGGILLGIVIGAGVASGVLLPAHASAHALFFYLVYACGLLTFLVLGLAAIEAGVNRQRMLDQDLLDMFLEHIPDNVFFKDRESRFLRISRAMAVHCNLADPGLAVHKTDADIFSAENAQHALADELEIVRTGKPVMSKEERETWPDGHETWVLTTKVPLKDRAGLIIGTMGISHDITERKQAEFRVQHITQHDDLTGLPNRILLQEKLGDAIAAARRNQKRGAILMLDLDRFRSVNDSLGHCMGDRLLQEAARRLREQLPETATVARLGGDEFAVVIPDLAEEDELERLPD